MASERVLFDSALVRIGHFVCPAGEPDWTTENIIQRGTLAVFPTVPVRIHQAGREAVIADRNVVMYYNPGQVYRRGLLHERGDEAVWFALDARLACELAAEFRPDAVEQPDSPFDRSHGPSPAGCYFRQCALADFLEGPGACDVLRVEETALTLVRSLLATDAGSRGVLAPAVKDETLDSRRAVVEEVRRLLALDPGFAWSLDALVDRVLMSPGHLCRVFKQEVGVSIHQYLLQLRLREAVQAVLDGERDLTALALRLGFSTHSHFTEAFRKAFGVPPRALRERSRVERAALAVA